MEVSEIIDEFRKRIGDTSKSVPESYIVSYINTALRRLARTDGLAPLFARHDTYELSTLNADGTMSAAWPLDVVGQIIDIDKLRLLVVNDSKVREVKPVYKELNDFFDVCALPEQQTPGDPNYYTIEQVGAYNRLMFNRPPCNLMAIDMIYSVFHKRIISNTETLQIPYAYADSVLEYTLILHKIETTDMSTARALYEDLDLIAVQIKELLATRKGTLPLRRIPRSF